MARFFIDRPIFAMALSILITLIGAIAGFSLPIAQYPNITKPQITVQTAYVGASSTTVEAAVAQAIEQKVNGVENMRELTGLTFERLPDAFDPQIRLADGTTTGGTGSRISPLFAATDADETLGTYVQNGRPAYVVKRTGQATTIFSGSYRLERPLLQDAVRRAGAWTYTDANDPVEANDAFFLLHARFPGVKKVRLPKTCDVVVVFRGEVVARGVNEFSFEAPLHSSWLFYCGDDADGYVKAISNHR